MAVWFGMCSVHGLCTVAVNKKFLFRFCSTAVVRCDCVNGYVISTQEALHGSFIAVHVAELKWRQCKRKSYKPSKIACLMKNLPEDSEKASILF